MNKDNRTFIERYIDILIGCTIRCYDDASATKNNGDEEGELYYLAECRGLLISLRALTEIGVGNYISEEREIALNKDIKSLETAVNQAHDTGYYAIFD